MRLVTEEDATGFIFTKEVATGFAAPIDIVGTYGGSAGSGGKLVKGVDGGGKMSLDDGNSRCSSAQEGAGLNGANFPPEPISYGPGCMSAAIIISAPPPPS
jgi:hypothetical protein